MAIEKQVVPSWQSHSLIMSMVNGIPLTQLVDGEGSFSHAYSNTKLFCQYLGKYNYFDYLYPLYIQKTNRAFRNRVVW